MKPKLSITSNHIPLKHLISTTSKIPLIKYDNSNPDIFLLNETFSTNYQQLYTKINYDLTQNATLILNPSSPNTAFPFEVITSTLKSTKYKFTSLNKTTPSKTPNYLSKLITILNPTISLLSLISSLIKYYLLIIILFLEKTFFKNKPIDQEDYIECPTTIQILKCFLTHIKTPSTKKDKLPILIYNPNSLNINHLPLPINAITIKTKLKKKQLNNYLQLIYIYDTYNPQNILHYLKTKSLCQEKNIQLQILKL